MEPTENRTNHHFEDYEEGFLSIVADGTIYFSTDRPNDPWEHDIFFAPCRDTSFETPRPIRADIKTSFSNPLIAHDGSFLLFESDAYGAARQADLYITFRQKTVGQFLSIWGRR